jgi:5-methylcytosine-specific restriction endonuclease McrA
MTRRRFTAKAKLARLLEYAGKCACGCGQKIDQTTGCEWDHIVPLAIGGDDDLTNMQPLTARCHRAKTAGDAGTIAKTRRQEQRAAGVKRSPAAIIPGSKASPWKRTIDGRTVRR